MTHSFDQDDIATRLAAYLDASPSPFHAVESAAVLLEACGFTRLSETEATPAEPGRYLLVRGGSLIAWSTEADLAPSAPFRVVGAHTDSPNLRIKPQPELVRAGWQQLAVEIYGGPLLNTWLDRDLGLSGRVAVRGADGVEGRLLLLDEPLLRVSQLAPHLDRTVNTDGLKLNPQQHLVPHWGLGTEPADFTGFVAERLEVERGDVLGWDLMTHDLTPARRIGRDRDLLASARLDNLATSFAAVVALIAALEDGTGVVPVVALFDHEEVGSTTERGAQSTFLPAVLERIVAARGGSREDYLRALAGTVIASGDMAHATNPNYADRHEPGHHVRMNGGPVLKINAQARYATDGMGAAHFRLACEQAGVPVQNFVTRTDLPCGSTVGPMTSALTGATTVDFGAPTLSMHSTREACGVADQAMYARALAAFLSPA
ncbi:M18 family aminopeptidase [Ornithinimicrobium ciconiae]|uniref:M18 family aminopeptidase n=1 Tax=Ornithinimicrobium ciconiae TaxID=2594265 RepID=UPI00192DBF36|nr:M18 family aminopeptidase [Ornithinimicrobium ciconiae]